MFDEITLPRAVLSYVCDHFVDDVELMIPRKDEFGRFDKFDLPRALDFFLFGDKANKLVDQIEKMIAL